MSEFDVKFAAYERSMKANNYFGLKGDQISEQFGRYATGLQRDEIKATNKKEGRKFAKSLAIEKKKLAAQKLQAELNGTAKGLPVKAEKAVVASQKVLDYVPSRNVSAFNLNDKFYVMENGKVIGYYSKFDKADWTKQLRNLKKEGVNIIQEAPYGEVSKSSQSLPAIRSEITKDIAKADAHNEVKIAQEANSSKGLLPAVPKTTKSTAEIALENARRADGKFRGVTAEQIDERLGIGKESDMTRQLKQEIKDRALENARRADGKFRGVTAEQIDERLGIGKESDMTRQLRQEIKDRALENARKADGKFRGVTAEQIDERLGIGKESDITKQLRQEELKSKALENARRADGKFRGVTAEQIDERLGIGKESPETTYFRKLEERRNKPRFKAKARLFRMKNPKLVKAGKAGLIGLAALALGSAIYSLFKKDKHDQIDMPQPVDEPNTETPITETPVEEPIETPIATPIEEPVEEPEIVSDETYTVKQGDNVWNIAKAHLKDMNKDVQGYEPSAAEILKETKRLMALNNLEFDNTREKKNWYVLIRPGDVLKLTGEPVEQQPVEPEPVETKSEEPVQTQTIVIQKPQVKEEPITVVAEPEPETKPEPTQPAQADAIGHQAIVDELNAKIQEGELSSKDLKKISKKLKKHEKNQRKLEKLADRLESKRHKYAIKEIKLHGKQNVSEEKFQTKKEVLEYKLENNY